MNLDQLIQKSNELQRQGFRFEFWTVSSGWFIKPDSEHWMLRTPQGAALPFYAALEKTLRTIEYLERR